jgi:hypothetical protein
MMILNSCFLCYNSYMNKKFNEYFTLIIDGKIFSNDIDGTVIDKPVNDNKLSFYNKIKYFIKKNSLILFIVFFFIVVFFIKFFKL